MSTTDIPTVRMAWALSPKCHLFTHFSSACSLSTFTCLSHSATPVLQSLLPSLKPCILQISPHTLIRLIPNMRPPHCAISLPSSSRPGAFPLHGHWCSQTPMRQRQWILSRKPCPSPPFIPHCLSCVDRPSSFTLSEFSSPTPPTATAASLVFAIHQSGLMPLADRRHSQH